MKRIMLLLSFWAIGNSLFGQEYPIIFYSDRDGNPDIFIKYPEKIDPVNLTNNPAKDVCPAISPDGKKVAFLSNRNGVVNIYLMNSDGSNVVQLTKSDITIEHPSWSVKGDKILFVKDYQSRTEIWTMRSDGTEQVKLTTNNARDERPFLSPDNSRIVFMSNREGNYEIYTMNADGSNQQRLTNTPYFEIFPIWSPNGKKIAYSQKIRVDGIMQGGIRVMNADGSNDAEVTQAATRDENPFWSPDGEQIVFQSVRDKNFELYTVRTDGTNATRITNNPSWDGWANFVPIETNDSILVVKAINASIGWAKTKNLSLLYQTIANDSSFMEIHPNNRIVKGFDDFRKAEKFWMHPDFKAVRYEIKGLKFNFSKSGDVAWFFCILDDINEWKGEPANWENTRWTGVLEKRDGNWVIVQQHFSFASKE